MTLFHFSTGEGLNFFSFIFTFIFCQENFPHSLRHVRPLLLCPLLRDRGSPLHRVLSSELSIPRFATFLSIVHVIRRRRAHQVIDCVSVFQVYDTRLIRSTPLYHFSKCDRLNCGSKALTPIILHRLISHHSILNETLIIVSFEINVSLTD